MCHISSTLCNKVVSFRPVSESIVESTSQDVVYGASFQILFKHRSQIYCINHMGHDKHPQSVFGCSTFKEACDFPLGVF